MAMVAEKAQTLLGPLFDSSFILRPVETCVKHICVHCQESLEVINVLMSIMLGGLVTAFVATVMISSIPALLFKGVRRITIPL